jgi:hypothetical protein
MMKSFLSTCFLLLCLVGADAAFGDSVSYRIVAYMDKYDQPAGLTEGSPGVFYGTAGSYSPVGFTITPQGAMTVVTQFPTGYHFGSLFCAAPNGRLYSTVQLSDNPASLFSVVSRPGREAYSPQELGATLTQALPTGEMLAAATKLTGISTITSYLAKADVKGSVTGIAKFPPSGIIVGLPIYANDGNFYGVAGTVTASSGYIFRVTPAGIMTTVYSFSSGFFPGIAPLLQANDGNLYGAEPSGGANGTGLIYEVTLDGQYTPLYTFPPGNNGGPTTLIEGSDGNLYGATLANFSAGGVGQLFRLTKHGEYTLLFALSNPTRDGACQCDMVQGSDGIFYGTTQGAGRTGAGAVFALDAGLPKPRPWAMQFNPRSGPAGTRVLIWGRNLLSPSVEFNGTAATDVTSSGPNYAWATVPTGATTGPITVTTPGGHNATVTNFTIQ